MLYATAVHILRRDVATHKLRYTKTLRADWAGAFFGAVVGLFVGYLGLSSVGAVSIDLSDLSSLILFAGIALAGALAAHRPVRQPLSLYSLGVTLAMPLRAAL